MIMKNKRVLLLNASHNDEGLLYALKQLGCFVITTGNKPYLEGHKIADKYVCGDYSNFEEMLKIAIEEKVDAICPCCNDFGVKTAAYVSEKLGFTGQDSYETTLIIHDKDKFKEFAQTNGEINTPMAKRFINIDDAVEYSKTLKDYPYIVKAVDLSAGNGIRKANNLRELIDNIHYSFDSSRNKHIIIEKYIEGPLNGLCTFIIDKKVVAYCPDREFCLINPYRVDSYLIPSPYIDEVKNDLINQIEFIAKKLNLVDGIFHLQYIYCNGKAVIIECMRRVLGNMYGLLANKYNGFDWDYWEAKAKCGYGVKDFPKIQNCEGYYGFRAVVSENNGRLKKVVIDKKTKNHIIQYKELIKKGEIIENCLSSPISLIFYKYNDKKEMNELMERYNKTYAIIEN